MAEVICPVCGIANPVGALTCFNCLSSLGDAIQPGEAPTKKGTGELEPILPEWLKQAREKSRQSQGSEIEEPQQEAQPISDLLAGLEAQAKPDEEEVPDWLAGITGKKSTKKNEPEPAGPRRVELGKPQDFIPDDTQPTKASARPPGPAEEAPPDWLKSLTDTGEDAGAGDLEAWFKEAAGDLTPGEESPGTQAPGAALPEEQASEWISDRQPASPAIKGELPDWLKELQDKPGQPSETGKAEIPDWLEELKAASHEEAAPAEPAKSAHPEGLAEAPGAVEVELPDWLMELRGTPEQPPQSGKAEVPDWLAELGAASPEEAAPEGFTELPQTEQPAGQAGEAVETELPDWLKNMQAEAAPASEPGKIEVPNWLEELGTPTAEETTPAQPDKATGFEQTAEQSQPTSEAGLPDWMKGLEERSEPAAEPGKEELPEWMAAPSAAFSGETVASEHLEPVDLQKPAEPEAEAGQLPGWLEDMHEEAGPAPEAGQAGVPDWLADLRTEPEAEAVPSDTSQLSGIEPAEEGESQAIEAELPDWLKELQTASEESPLATEESGAPGWVEAQHKPVQEDQLAAALDVDLPDWLDNLDKEPSPVPPVQTGTELPDWLSETIAAEAADVKASDFEATTNALAALESTASPKQPVAAEPVSQETEAVFEPEIPEGDLSSLFTEVPDWLGKPEASTAPTEAAGGPTAGEEAESISPVDLPAWVQAMRPVEATVAPAAAGEAEENEELETSGPLAGLRGVLPSFAYPGPTGKPKAQSIKLQAEQDQLDHATLLEQILQAETSPEPMAAPASLSPLRSLSIGIGLALLLVLLAAIFAGTTIFPLPSGQPAETAAAMKALGAIPANAPVLTVFDYEPSLAGEMEATAAPLLSQLISQKAPHLTLLSTSPTGSALAERLFSGPLQQLAFQNYTNLGYLAGGLGGVRSFAQNPVAAMPLATDAAAAALGVQHMADYAAIIVITDSADSGRTWIEQAAHLIGPDRFVVIASAQAGPMLQPYYQSGQIAGLVTGLFDSAVLEQNNAARPGLARRYWDAYNLGLILAVVLLTIGALWNLVQGIRERSAAQEAE